MSELVSCVMATTDRPGFLRRAISHYRRFEWPKKELVIVVNGRHRREASILDAPDIRVTALEDRWPIGDALNFGIAAADGDWIVRMDDDDWYHPRWIEAVMSRMLSAPDQRRALSAAAKPLVWLARTGELRRFVAPPHWPKHIPGECMIGSSYAYHRTLWEESPYPSMESGEDAAFFARHAFHYVPVEREGMFVYVRHGKGSLSGVPHEYYERECPLTEFVLEEVVGETDAAFYRAMEMAASGLDKQQNLA